MLVQYCVILLCQHHSMLSWACQEAACSTCAASCHAKTGVMQVSCCAGRCRACSATESTHCHEGLGSADLGRGCPAHARVCAGVPPGRPRAASAQRLLHALLWRRPAAQLPPGQLTCSHHSCHMHGCMSLLRVAAETFFLRAERRTCAAPSSMPLWRGPAAQPPPGQQVVSQVVIVMLFIGAAPALRLLHQLPCYLGFLSCHCVKDALCLQVYALIAIACAKLGHIIQHHSRKSQVGPATAHAAFPNPGLHRKFLDDPF